VEYNKINKAYEEAYALLEIMLKNILARKILPSDGSSHKIKG